MPSTYTTNLGIELPADGELDGVWGDVVNENMDILDRAINGSIALSLSGTTSTLTTSDGALSDGQYKLLVLGGSPSGTHTITIAPNDAQKIYFVRNTTAQSVVFTQGSGGNVTVATGDSAIIYSDGAGAGAAVVNITNDFAMSSVKITGGTIDGTTIGGSSPAVGTFTTANATTVDTTNIEVTTLKAKDGTSAGSIADSTGVVTLASSVLTTTDINGGTIDGAVIGGSSAAAGTFTTVTASGDVTIADKIVHSGDTNTAIRFPAADTVTVETSGAERLRVDSSGNVGIGDGKQYFWGTGRTAVQGSSASDIMQFFTASVERARITSAGNVGIGTTSPSQLLHVQSTSGAAGSAVLRLAASGSTSLQVGQEFFSTTTANVTALRSGRIYSAFDGTAYTDARLSFQSMTSGDVLVDTMHLKGGNVGIGTTSPSATLDIEGLGNTVATHIFTSDNVSNATASLVFGTTPGARSKASIQMVNINTGNAEGALAFSTNSGASLIERMRIDGSGNVGVGITNPAYKLVVSAAGASGIELGPAYSGTANLIQHYSRSGGVYVDAVNDAAQHRFNTSGTERMRITSAGNVGIGTTAPAELIHIAGGASAAYLKATNSAGTQGIEVGVSATGDGVVNVQDAKALRLFTTDTERMRIDSSGNVGIGTSSPSADLSVGSTTTSSGDVHLRTTKTAVELTPSNSDAGGMDFNVGWVAGGQGPLKFSLGSTERARIDVSGNLLVGLTTGGKFSVSYGGNDTHFGLGANYDNYITAGASGVTILRNGNTERARIDASGNLLVGTASASYSSSGRGVTILGGSTSGLLGFQIGGTAKGYVGHFDSSMQVWNEVNSPILFGTNSAERARITSAGDLLVGTTNTAINDGVGIKLLNNDSRHVSAVSSQSANASGESFTMYSTGASAFRFYVGWGGTVFATSTTISAISDQRLKENVQDLDVGLDAVMQLKPRKFDWKSGKGKDTKGDRGWIAQEFEQVFPDMIDTWKDPSPDGEEPYKSVRADLIPVLVKAIQELKAEVDSLRAQLNP